MAGTQASPICRPKISIARQRCFRWSKILFLTLVHVKKKAGSVPKMHWVSVPTSPYQANVPSDTRGRSATSCRWDHCGTRRREARSSGWTMGSVADLALPQGGGWRLQAGPGRGFELSLLQFAVPSSDLKGPRRQTRSPLGILCTCEVHRWERQRPHAT